MAFYGLDFGTTNSSISIIKDGKPYLFPIDLVAPKASVIRSALYFYPREFVIHSNVPKTAKETQVFDADQFHYEGEVRNLIGSGAVGRYLEDIRTRHAGIKRRVYTGKIIKDVILYITPGGKTVTGNFPEYYEEFDYGTGRLFHALKTALKSPVFKGNRVFGDFYDLEQLIGILLGTIKRQADQISGENVDSVICGRPVHFSPDPIKDKAAEDRLKESVLRAGFKDIKFEYEPVAAAKYYLSKNPSQKQKVLVFDFGGGTLDTTIMENSNGFRVLATDGVYIGGDLLNSDIFYHKLGKYFGTKATWGDKNLSLPTHIVTALQSWYGIPNLNNPRDISFISEESRYKNSDPEAMNRLLHLIQRNLGFEIYESIEVAKKSLTYKDEETIRFTDGPIEISETITRADFEELIKPRVEEVKKTILRTLESANLEPDEIGVVVRTGGSSLIPIFENMLIDIFGADKVVEFDPFTSIAAGLAL